MREKEVEEYLTKQAKARGWLALKFVSPGCTGVPDRIVILPGGRVGFLELKAPGEIPRKDQQNRIRQLRALGCTAGWADTKEKVDRFLTWLECQNGSEELLQEIQEAGGLT